MEAERDIKIRPEWEEIIREMKQRMTVEEILLDLGHDRYFFKVNGLNYVEPPIDALREYIERL
ncbi:MAG TPA: hypothetical protein ENG00_00020 [Candidatus Aenigmarchaeota archaeon]|nr:hypothetical protein [Candidatus Aenigmarchaeota archaeon]